MHLSPKMLQDITGSAVPCADRHRRELRRTVRLPLARRAAILPLNSARRVPLAIRIRDISLSGIGILQWKEMRPGEEFVLVVPRRNQAPLCIRCIVRRCLRVEAEAFVIGAGFVALVGQDQFPQPEAECLSQLPLPEPAVKA